MTERQRFKQTESLTDRLATFAKLMRERAAILPAGQDRSAILAKAEQADKAAQMDEWMKSSELKPPR
jgi:hypothetical protein